MSQVIQETMFKKTEVMKRLHISSSTFYRLLLDRQFPNAFQVGNRWRIPKSDLDAYIASRTMQ
jgi:excisionase family DNA binding protein